MANIPLTKNKKMTWNFPFEILMAFSWDLNKYKKNILIIYNFFLMKMDFWYLPIGDEIFERWEHDIHAVQKCVAQKQKKEFLIVVAHTIVHPRAVMVHF